MLPPGTHLRSVLTLTSEGISDSASIGGIANANESTSENEVKIDHHPPVNAIQNEATMRYLNAASFQGPYYANMRMPDRDQHFARLTEYLTLVELVLRS